jgi:glycosyltransferase involved in cell wall biosynthesis
MELRGGQRQLLLLASGLRDRSHEQLIVCANGSALEARARQHQFEVLPLRRRGLRRLGGIVRVRHRLRRDGFQILHAHDGRGQTVSTLASLGLPVRRVATRRVIFMPRGLGRILELPRLQYGPFCNAIIAVSAYIRDLLTRAGIQPSKIEVIPDGTVIPSDLPGDKVRDDARRRWDLPTDAFVMGHAGAFTLEKGQDVLLEAFSQVSISVAGARLLLVGEGPLRDSPRISELLDRSEGRARVLDSMDDLTPFFAALDLYVMPSRSEGLGSSSLLAMAHGLPVVASRVGGLSEVVEDGTTGWLVPPESSAELARTLMAAASDRASLRRFGASARQRARAFSDDTMVSHTEALYRRLLTGADSR